jgi:hypothetical protein
MENKTVSAAQNPGLANKLIQQAIQDDAPVIEKAEVKVPFSNVVDLPGGYVTLAGEVITTAEVRELTGRDEEAIIKAPNIGKALITILNRGVVKIGEMSATEPLLDELLVGDRDALILGIYRATFGDTVDLSGYDTSTGQVESVTVNLVEDIKHKVLTDVINERRFTVKGKKNEYVVALPTGTAQKEMAASSDKSVSELTSILLYHCVKEINGGPVYSIEQIRALGIADRQMITEELTNRAPGPQFDDITVPNPETDGKVVVPISLGTIFRL